MVTLKLTRSRKYVRVTEKFLVKIMQGNLPDLKSIKIQKLKQSGCNEKINQSNRIESLEVFARGL